MWHGCAFMKQVVPLIRPCILLQHTYAALLPANIARETTTPTVQVEHIKCIHSMEKLLVVNSIEFTLFKCICCLFVFRI